MESRAEQIIITRYRIFDRYRYPNTSYHFAGFECPTGWAILLVEFARRIQQLQIKKLVIFQIKEKFNQLRIYAECEPEHEDELDDLIIYIEQKSGTICGRCGDFLTSPHKCHGRCACGGAMQKWVEQLTQEGAA